MKKHLSILFCLLFTLGTHAQGDSIAFAEMPDGTRLCRPTGCLARLMTVYRIRHCAHTWLTV